MTSSNQKKVSLVRFGETGISVIQLLGAVGRAVILSASNIKKIAAGAGCGLIYKQNKQRLEVPDRK
jgi:hypothetical protein